MAGLADEIGGAERPRMAGIGVVVLTGKDDDAQFRCQFQQFGNQREPLVRAMRQGRQAKVDQCQRRRLPQLPQQLDRLRSRRAGHDVIGVAQGDRECVGDQRIVIDDQQ